MEQQGRVAGLCSTGREEGSHYSDFTQGSIHRNIAQKQGIRGLNESGKCLYTPGSQALEFTLVVLSMQTSRDITPYLP